MTDSLRILVVDDEPTIRELLTCVLEEAGHEVTVAGGGRACVERCAEGDFDLVLMDLDMPDWDGRTAIKAIHQGKPELRVLVVSAVMNTDIKALIEQYSNVMGWISKPFELDLLLSKVAEAVSTGG